MALPSSGQLSLKDIYRERTGSFPPINANISLRLESVLAGFDDPYRIAQFYGYSAGYSVNVNLSYADSAGPDDYLTGFVVLRNAANTANLQTRLIPDVVNWSFSFDGIEEDCRVSFANVGITRNGEGVPMGQVYWGINGPAENLGTLTSIITEAVSVYGKFYYYIA